MKATRKGNTIKVKAEAGDGYRESYFNKTLCRLRNNGNGWDVKFYSHSSIIPDIRMNLDYEQAAVLAKAFSEMKEKQNEPENSRTGERQRKGCHADRA
jgi:hypothetical protein